MSQYNHEEEELLSDEEIFWSKLNRLEQRHTLDFNSYEKDNNRSFTLIETHSQPNLRPVLDKRPELSSSPDLADSDPQQILKSEASTLQIENMASELCLSPRKANNNLELNDTSEFIDYVLKGSLSTITDSGKSVEFEEFGFRSFDTPESSTNEGPKSHIVSPEVDHDMNFQESAKYIKPIKDQSDELVTSASGNLQTKISVFRTPTKPISQMKPPDHYSKKTPNKGNAYQHIASPVALYIKQSPATNVIKNVKPRRPLVGTSSIPILVKDLSNSKNHNKENKLPISVYKSAKNTKVINLPNEEKLPQSQWANKITSALPRALVMKHESREGIAKEQVLTQHEDSFNNISVVQAETSICTQKTAFKNIKDL